MSNIIRAIGYTGNLQRLVVPAGFAADIIVYAWGGGGGGSGGDSGGARPGGNGGGGGYIAKTLSVVPGDVLDIAVGEGGGVGGGATQGGSGSAAGQSYTVYDPTPTYGGVAQVAPIPTVPYDFGYPSGTGFYTRTRRINSDPLSYDILEWWVIINGAVVQTGGNSDWESNTYIAGTYRGSVTAYNVTYTYHPGSGSPRIPATYVPASNQDQINAFDLYYYSGVSYCGGHGGASVIHYSGAGGGGGGATVVLLNGVIVGYAAGGGGGGGCGNAVGAGQNAPGPNGQSVSATAGSDGQTFGVGGGGGGGGGGNGGAGAPSETLAQAGAFGRNLGDYTELPDAMQPGGINTPYYAGEPGHGGIGQNTGNGGGQPGTSGYAVVEMQSKSFQIKDSGIWKPVNNSFIKHNNAWLPIKATYVKQNGTWAPVVGTSDAYAPYFANVPGYFGTIPRGYGT